MNRVMIFTLGLCLSGISYASNFSFMKPKHSSLSLSIQGSSQAGKSTHKLEILQLGHQTSYYKEGLVPTQGYYLVYYAGEEYGPDIIEKLDGHTPYIVKKTDGTIEVQFTRGNNGHTKIIYNPLGHTVEKVSEKEISHNERLYYEE